jgi:glyoxylase-like metal-dependent hydrolase (beta-lactamase superfamily II)
MRRIIFFILLTASLQGSAQQEHYQVYALKFANTSFAMPISVWVDHGPQNDSVNIDFSIWLIKGDQGRNILVDAGFERDLIDSPDGKEFAITNYQRPDSVLQKLGLKAGDITDIILSHPHWDHCDGIGLFPNARIWMQKEDYGYFVGTAWQKDVNNGGFYKRDVLRLVGLNLAGRLTLVDGDDKEIIPGIKVFTGSRHTFDSQYVLVEAGGHKIVLASDNIWIYYSLEHLQPASPGGTFDPQGYVRAMIRMKTLTGNTRYIIPGHDARVFALFPNVAPGVVEIK